MSYLKSKIASKEPTDFKVDNAGVIWFKDRLVVLKVPELHQILDEAHITIYSIYLESNKMYQDLKDIYWWTKVKIEIACC